MTQARPLCLDGNDWTVYWLLPNEWLWRKVWEGDPPEAAARQVPAAVPGHAQEALLRAEVLPHPYVGLSSREWEWTSARDWVFEKRFTLPEDFGGACVWLRFAGLDDAAHVFLNGTRVGDHTGQFVPAEWEVASLLKHGEENHLVVVVERAPEVQGQIGWTSRERRWKSRFAYGWDWCTRLVPVGIWDSVSLAPTGTAWLRDVAIHTNIATDRSEAAVSIVCELGAALTTPVLVHTDITQNGLPVATVEDAATTFGSDTVVVQSVTIPRVQLWWPNGSGRQPLYEARIILADRAGNPLDARRVTFGVRTVDAIRCDGAPPDSLPYSLSLNGKRVWIQGWNWVPLDHFYGSVDEARYERLLRLAKDAGVNMLRVWGGGLLEKEPFYRWCDQLGILVWQEFPLSSSGLDNTPASDPAYLEYVREQAEAMIPRRRNHPSLVLWGGGNELTDAQGAPLGSDHPALAELRSSVELDDPQRLWLPTSPTGPHFSADPARRGELHDVHGPWLWQGLRETPHFYNAIDPLLHSEFGCEGAANLDTLRWIFGQHSGNGLTPPHPAEEGQAPEIPLPRAGDPIWMAHGGAWWLRPAGFEAAFGAIESVEQFVRGSQLLQAMGLQYAIEANRRRMWRCAGTLPWQLNEAWPNAICTNAVDYFGHPKPAYYAVKRAYQAFHVSAAFPTFDWQNEPAFSADVWLHNAGEERSLLNVVARVTDLQGRELYQENLAAEAPAEAAENAGDLHWRFPSGFADPFVLLLEVVDEEGETIAWNHYFHSRAASPPFAGFLTAPATEVRMERTEVGLVARNVGQAVALGVSIRADGALVEESDFPLCPGEARDVRLVGDTASVEVSSWNGRVSPDGA